MWAKEFQAKTSGKCPIYNCNNVLALDTSNSWQGGHIISVFNNGKTELSNLRPICPKCNLAMSNDNWEDWVNSLARNEVEETYFDDKCVITCKIQGCHNKITKSTFKPFEVTKNGKIKYVPICSLCYES